jgi:hypothetical protein
MTRVLCSAALALVMSSCSIPTESGELGALPDSKSFIDNGVSTFMERRCGGLDCHGQPGRPLRLYSEWGLRLEANKDGTRDKRPTTRDEQIANYRSVVGLEPENLEACYRTGGKQKASFQLLLKPLGIENNGIRHKGGPVLRASTDDPGWQCLLGWASGQVNKADCDKAATLTN